MLFEERKAKSEISVLTIIYHLQGGERESAEGLLAGAAEGGGLPASHRLHLHGPVQSSLPGIVKRTI